MKVEGNSYCPQMSVQKYSSAASERLSVLLYRDNLVIFKVMFCHFLVSCIGHRAMDVFYNVVRLIKQLFKNYIGVKKGYINYY